MQIEGMKPSIRRERTAVSLFAVLAVFASAACRGSAVTALGAESITNFVTVGSIQERDNLPRVDGLAVLIQLSGNIHRWSAASNAWTILNDPGVVNLRDFGAVPDSGYDNTAVVSNALAYAAKVGARRIVFPSHGFHIARPIVVPAALSSVEFVGGPADVFGDHGGDTDWYPLFDISVCTNLAMRFKGLRFSGYRNVVRNWSASPVSSGWLLFENCRFGSGEYIVANNAPNVFVGFRNGEIQIASLFKGAAEAVVAENFTVMTRGLVVNTHTIPWTTNYWSGGWCESGGTEDGIECGAGASFLVDNLMTAPLYSGPDQAWFKMWEPGDVLIKDSRLGGESSVPLVRKLKPGGSVAVEGMDHYSLGQPRYFFDAAPDAFSETGVGGLGESAALGADSWRNAIAQPALLADARLRLIDEMSAPKGCAPVGTINYNPMPYDPVSRTTNADSYAVFTTVGANNVIAANLDLGFEGLKGKRYTVADANRFTGQTGVFGNLRFEALTNRLYNLTLLYRSANLQTYFLWCRMPKAWSGAGICDTLECASMPTLPDTRGALVQATVSFYVEREGVHTIDWDARFCDSSGYLEVYPISITDGPFAGAYLNGPRWAGAAQDPDPAPNDQSYYSQQQTTLHFMGSAAPKRGTWRKGSFVCNNKPKPGNPFGWVCTRDGTPGEWHPVELSYVPTGTASAERSGCGWRR
ncbi:MAG: hypothetical protein PHR35_09715 [Kiritimatiellae bacterium]|nr:hypothetical protein [Kiritimatiellia bacterium]